MTTADVIRDTAVAITTCDATEVILTFIAKHSPHHEREY
jgi:hypothetical protein